MTKVAQNFSLNHLGICLVLISEKSFSRMYFRPMNSALYFCFFVPSPISWVSSYQNGAWSPVIHFDQLQVLASKLEFQMEEIAGETVKLLPSTNISTPKKLKPKNTRFRKWTFVSLYLSGFVFTCSRKENPLSSILLFTAQHCSCNFDISTVFERHLARLATVIFIRSAHLNMFSGCSCRCVRNHFLQLLHSKPFSSGPNVLGSTLHFLQRSRFQPTAKSYTARHSRLLVLPWEPKTFIFRGYFTHILGV